MRAEEAGQPFITYRDPSGRQWLLELDGRGGPLAIGRRSSCDVALSWDDEVSRVHAELHSLGGDWLLVDDGVSSNGSLVNGKPVTRRQRLHDRDVLRFGSTVVVYRDPRERPERDTHRTSNTARVRSLTEAQRRVLIALCRPYFGRAPFAVPATNRAIADELYITVDAVKKQLRTLFQRFGLESLPHNEKRARLAERAVASGLIVEEEL